MRKEIAFWLLILLFASCVIGLTVARADEKAYTNGDIYALLYESGTKPWFSTNVTEKGKIPAFVQRGEIQCNGIEEESLTTGGAMVTTCIEIPPAARQISIQGATA